MKLRFDVDQAAAFRAGVDAPTSYVTLEVAPGSLTVAQRELIADRLVGIDVKALATSPVGTPLKSCTRLTAQFPTLTSLMDAVREDARQCTSTK